MPFVNKKLKVGDLVKSNLHSRFTGFAIITKIHIVSDTNNGLEWYPSPYVSLVWQDSLGEDSCSSNHLDLVSRANEEK